MAPEGPTRSALIALYRDRGAIESGRALSLPEHCAHAGACWTGIAGQRYKATTIALPWIGADYPTSRLLVIGENLNGDNEGIDILAGENGYVSAAIAELAERRRVRFGNPPTKYAGSLLWHCIGAYAAAILGDRPDSGFRHVVSTDGDIASAHVRAAHSHIAYTNHVKCSIDDGHRSQPSPAMWQRCGAHFLAAEMEILAPEVILALGRGNNGTRLVSMLQAAGTEVGPEASSGSAVVSRSFQVDHRRVELLIVPHPSYYRVPWGTVVRALRERFTGGAST